MASQPNQSVYIAPIATALKNMGLWLNRDENSIFIVAAPTIKELKQQVLPSHIRITPKKRQGKRVMMRGRRHYHQAYSQTARWPEDALVESALYTLACVTHGQADFRIADYVLHCQAGDIVLFPPGTPRNDGSRGHCEKDLPGQVCEILWMDTQSTETDGLRCWICRSEGTKHSTGRALGSCWIPHRFSARLYQGLCEEAHNGRRRDVVNRLFADLILLLRDEIENGNALEEWGRPRYYGKDGGNDFIEEALSYIQENIAYQLTINDVANHVSVSSATFTRRFKEQTGETFQQYQTKLRMKLAEELLLNSQYPIQIICRRVGLKYGRLWALFQEKRGCTPTEFRHQKNDSK